MLQSNIMLMIISFFRTTFENREIVELVNEHFLFWVQSSGGTAGKQGKQIYVTINIAKIQVLHSPSMFVW